MIAKNHRFHQAINGIPDNPEALLAVNRHWTLVAALWRHYDYGEAHLRQPQLAQQRGACALAALGLAAEVVRLVVAAIVVYLLFRVL